MDTLKFFISGVTTTVGGTVGILYAVAEVDPESETLEAVWGIIGELWQFNDLLSSLSGLDSVVIPFIVAGAIIAAFIGAIWAGGWWGVAFFIIGAIVGNVFISQAPKVPESVLLVLILGFGWPKAWRAYWGETQ